MYHPPLFARRLAAPPRSHGYAPLGLRKRFVRKILGVNVRTSRIGMISGGCAGTVPMIYLGMYVHLLVWSEKSQIQRFSGCNRAFDRFGELCRGLLAQHQKSLVHRRCCRVFEAPQA
jgi:hypothetical protein